MLIWFMRGGMIYEYQRLVVFFRAVRLVMEIDTVIRCEGGHFGRQQEFVSAFVGLVLCSSRVCGIVTIRRVFMYSGERVMA
jgi:hypothetical protein